MNKPEMTTDHHRHSDRDLLILDLRALIVNSVNLHHLKAGEFTAETPFGPTGLNLDSIDILEVVVAIEQKYNVKVNDVEVGRKYFSTLAGIADFLMGNRK
jgi:acyl carrier protein